MKKLMMPAGISDFEKVRREGYYYVDKTNLICDLLEQNPTVTLITRPRRFGKTIAMDMLYNFFDIHKNSKEIFEGLNISENTELCSKWMNQYPTIFLSFKEIDGRTFDLAYARLKMKIGQLFRMYEYVLDCNKISDEDKATFIQLKKEQASEAQVCASLSLLVRLLEIYHQKPVILLLDEYDVPVAKASDNGYYTEMLDVMRNIMQVFKDNKSLCFAVITGCLRIAKESIFTGTNNFVTNTITDTDFGEYFGFTQDEVLCILKDAGAIEYADQVKQWYDGYRFGNFDIYCPWSIINYVRSFLKEGKTIPECYWNNTSGNTIIRSFIDNFSIDIGDEFEELMEGGYVIKNVEEDLTYDFLHSSEDNFWSILYLTGYLTKENLSESSLQRGQLHLRIPNKEVREIFNISIRNWFNDTIKTVNRQDLFQAVWDGKCDTISDRITDILLMTISFHDYGEDFYHAFLAGIFTGAGYKVESNKEHGLGRSDIVIFDKRNRQLAVFELKHSTRANNLEKDCAQALEQLRDNLYTVDFSRIYKKILCYGISFYKKECLVKADI